MAHRTRFGIVGLGAFGSSAVTGVLKDPNAELVAVADRDPARAEAIGTERGVPWTADYRELLKREDVDVIGVFTPSNQHHDVVLEAAAAGKHVLSTKPLEVSLERASRVASVGSRCEWWSLMCRIVSRYPSSTTGPVAAQPARPASATPASTIAHLLQFDTATSLLMYRRPCAR